MVPRDRKPTVPGHAYTARIFADARYPASSTKPVPIADQQPGATPAEIEFAHRWRDMPKVVFSSTIDKVDWDTRLVTGDAIAEITRLKAEDGGPMDIAGATLAAAAMRAGLIDEYALATHPVLVGGGTPFFTALDSWVNLNLVETRTFPGGVVLTRYETRR